MSIPRFYQNKPLSLGNCSLDEMAAHHIVHVLRLKIGAEIIVFNGDGNEFKGILSQINKKTVQAELQHIICVENESSLRLHLVQSISRRERMDLTLQKAVELGVAEITPVISDFCNLKQNMNELNHKQDHWQQIIISATQQCGRTRLPTLNPIFSFKEALSQVKAEQRFFLSPRTNVSSKTVLAIAATSAALFIGCEGGFSENEEVLADAAGLTAMALGPRILRTETAAIVAMAILQHRLGDL